MIRCFRYTSVCHAEATVNKKFGGTYVPACRKCAADIDALKALPAPAPTQDAAPPAPPPPPPSRWKLRPDADAHPKLCRVDKCGRVVKRRGVCHAHFSELYAAGDAAIMIPAMSPSDVARRAQAARAANKAAMREKLAG
jgi:hypothetical protein